MTAWGLGRAKTFWGGRRLARAGSRASRRIDCSIFFAISGLQLTLWLPLAAVSDLAVPKMGVAMPTPHVWIAAMSGFTPTMFMTRVRL
jgi:hypothetical protein